MRSARAPRWLAAPSRFAHLSSGGARVGIALLVLLLLASLLALGAAGPSIADDARAATAPERLDVVLYATIVDGIRHGGSYYAVAADALRAGDYPLRPFVAFRLPTLAVIEAHLPPAATLGLLYALVAATAVAWYRRLRPALAGLLPRVAAALLIAAGLIAFVQPDLAYFHEIWAGPLIALSLAVRRPGAWLPAVAFGLAAALVRETALPYLLLMAFFATIERQWRELAGWAVAIGVFAVVLALHAHAVAMVVRPLDPASPGWAGLLGFGFFVRTMAASTALVAAPLWLAAPLVALALAGWAAWRDDLALRVLTLLSGYAAVLATVGRADTYYWGLLVAPLLLIGLVFAPDGIGDLVARARDTRRITVRRTVR